MSEREKPEDFELDSGICWPEFDKMSNKEKAAYYKEHPLGIYYVVLKVETTFIQQKIKDIHT